MTRFIMPIVLTAIAIVTFFMFTDPLYNGISTLKEEVASYNEALDNAKALENERDILTTKLNAISKDDLAKLEKLLPKNVDNIRLILEMQQVASPFGMVLKDVRYGSNEPVSTSNSGAVARTAVGDTATSDKSYGTWDLEFSTAATYGNFINFVKALESNLRIADISSVQFSSTDSGPGSSLGVYKYGFKIKTYWLKN